MKNKLIVFLVLALVSTSVFLSVRLVFAASIFEDGFESGNFSAWTGTWVESGDVANVGVTHFHHGSYGAYFSIDDAWNNTCVYEDVSASGSSTLFFRFYIYLTELPSSGKYVLLAHIGTYQAFHPAIRLRLYDDSGTYRLGYKRFYPSESTVDGNVISISANEWHCYELKVVKSAGAGEYRTWFDGTETASETGLDTSGATLDYCSIGIWGEGWMPSGNQWFDCAVVDSSYIGPESYTLTASVVGQGSVSKSPDQATYDWGTNVELTAHANLGWTFAGWSGGASGTSTPVTVTITDDTAVTATFTQNEYTLVTSVVGSGSVTLNNPGPYHHGDVVQLTAVPTSGWSFHSWGGDLSGSANPTMITIDGNKAVTATFTQNPAPPVGGEWVPIDKLQLSTPWISLISSMTILTTSFVYVRRKRQQN